MNTKKIFFSIAVVLYFAYAKGGDMLTSPNGKIQVNISTAQINLSLQINLSRKKAIEIKAGGLQFDKDSFDFTGKLQVVAEKRNRINDDFFLPLGKNFFYSNQANEQRVIMKNSFGKMMTLIIRAYNDGVAFRYAFTNDMPMQVKVEATSYLLPQTATTWAMEYRDDSENFYTKRTAADMNAAIYDFPVLVKTPAQQWMLLHEADVLGKSTSSAITGNTGNGKFDITWQYPTWKYEDWMPKKWSELSTLETFVINADKNFVTPWRMIIMGETLAPVIESTMAENLNPPPAITVTKNMKAGVAVFPWWADHNANQDTTVLKKYIDLAVAMGWGVVEFDISLIGSPSFAIDKWLTTPWVKNVVDYAHSKGIQVFGWDERMNLDTKAERDFIFGKYKALGVDGIKIDFMNSRSQLATTFRYDCLKDAASYGLMISFHGEMTPRGERRTFPNLMTQEGVKGAEHYEWDDPNPITAKHNVSLVYTRNVIGPMDYTPTVYSAKKRKTTYAHETACAFAFESGWQCMADKPEAYLNAPTKEILQQVEASWDETKFIAGQPDDYVILARRKGNK